MSELPGQPDPLKPVEDKIETLKEEEDAKERAKKELANVRKELEEYAVDATIGSHKLIVINDITENNEALFNAQSLETPTSNYETPEQAEIRKIELLEAKITQKQIARNIMKLRVTDPQYNTEYKKLDGITEKLREASQSRFPHSSPMDTNLTVARDLIDVRNKVLEK
jgi:hypothetical protein